MKRRQATNIRRGCGTRVLQQIWTRILRDWIADLSGGLGPRILRGYIPTKSHFVGLFGLRREHVPFFGVYDWVSWQEAAMHTPMHWRTERGRYFQTHPLHATFSLVASMLLAGLVVLVLVLSAR